jgi:hypothetical protein
MLATDPVYLDLRISCEEDTGKSKGSKKLADRSTHNINFKKENTMKKIDVKKAILLLTTCVLSANIAIAADKLIANADLTTATTINLNIVELSKTEAVIIPTPSV